MVSTRRQRAAQARQQNGVPSAPPATVSYVESSSSSDNDIEAELPSRHKFTLPTVATLRPSKNVVPAADTGAGKNEAKNKRKRGKGVQLKPRQDKRQKSAAVEVKVAKNLVQNVNDRDNRKTKPEISPAINSALTKPLRTITTIEVTLQSDRGSTGKFKDHVPAPPITGRGWYEVPRDEAAEALDVVRQFGRSSRPSQPPVASAADVFRPGPMVRHDSVSGAGSVARPSSGSRPGPVMETFSNPDVPIQSVEPATGSEAENKQRTRDQNQIQDVVIIPNDDEDHEDKHNLSGITALGSNKTHSGIPELTSNLATKPLTARQQPRKKPERDPYKVPSSSESLDPPTARPSINGLVVRNGPSLPKTGYFDSHKAGSSSTKPKPNSKGKALEQRGIVQPPRPTTEAIKPPRPRTTAISKPAATKPQKPAAAAAAKAGQVPAQRTPAAISIMSDNPESPVEDWLNQLQDDNTNPKDDLDSGELHRNFPSHAHQNSSAPPFATAPRPPYADPDETLFVQPPTSSLQATVPLPSAPITALYHLMAKPGWTALGPDWEPVLFPPDADEQEPEIKLGGFCFHYIRRLKELFDKSPQFPDLGTLAEWLCAKRAELTRLYQNVDESVDKICRDVLDVYDDDEAMRNRRTLALAVVRRLVPALVLALESAWCMGGTVFEEDGEGMWLLPEGSFTVNSLELVGRITGWLRRFYGVVVEGEVARRPLTGEELVVLHGGEGGHGLMGPVEQQQKEIWAAVGVCLEKLRRAKTEAVVEFERAAEEERRLRECVRRDKAFKLAKEMREDAERESERKQYEAFARSTQEIRMQPTPFQMQWYRAQGIEPPAAAAGARPAPAAAVAQQQQQRRSGGGGGGGGGSSSSGGRRSATVTGAQSEAEALGVRRPPIDWGCYMPWPEDNKQWLLDELRRSDRTPCTGDYEEYAEALGVTADEVRRETELLRFTARMLAAKKGKVVAGWARE